MGEIFEALDEVSGERVAVKVLLGGREAHNRRFEREAEVLAHLTHPGIVGHLAHGRTATGEPYLVMEWLEGEDLGDRLGRGPLTVEEALTVGSLVARALAAAHARGVIHRDLKPRNVFLVGGRLDQVRILDFGIALLAARTNLTETGAMLGTPGYMAPEQARSDARMTPRADVFTLGCLLFECVAGAPAFPGDSALSVLARILFGEVPRLSSLRAAVPQSLSALVARMLSQDPLQRPDAAAVAEALTGISSGDQEAVHPWMEPPRRLPSLTGVERHLLSVVLLEPEPAPEDLGPESVNEVRTAPEALRAAAAPYGGRLEVLPDGALLVAVQGPGVATDHAAQAARCALALRAAAPGRALALAMGRTDGNLMAGEAIDRAVDTLSRCLSSEVRRSARNAHASGAPPPPIAVDELTASLLDGRFDVREGEAGLDLYGEREVTTGTRLLLGKPTSCVGRGRELISVASIFAECVEQSAAQAVLVSGAAGMGKSRLLHEVLGVVRARHDVDVWTGRADPLRKGSAFGLLGQALRNTAGIVDGEPLAVRQDKLQARVRRRVAAEHQDRVAAFLGEILGTPWPDDDRPSLRAARHEPAIMSEQMRLAWEDFLRAEAAAGPVLLVLEDLHWGDLPTVRFLDSALRGLKDLPWMVLALARPEVHQLFPSLWEARDCHEIRLRMLSPRDSARLVQQVLGEDAEPELVARVVAQADGNPFYLEELIRAAAQPSGEALPATVVAMVHGRLSRLKDEERRVLRAASVFGETFAASGVGALVGGALGAAGAAITLEALVDQEVLVRRPPGPLEGEGQLAFRHALLREGAYAMLTDADRALGHRLAAEWLEVHGESDPMVLAEHHDRGRDLDRAGAFYARAGERALQASDMDAAIARSERALACGVTGAARIAVLSILAESNMWANRWRDAARYAEAVLAEAPSGSAPWGRAAAARLGFAMSQGEMDRVVATMDLALRAEPAPKATGELAAVLSYGCLILASQGHFEATRAGLARLHALVEPVQADEPVARGWMHAAHGSVETLLNEDPWAGAAHSELALAGFREANHHQGELLTLARLGMNLWLLGSLPGAEQSLRSAISGREESLGSRASLPTFCLVSTLADAGDLDEAHRTARRMLAHWLHRELPSDEGRAHSALAVVLHRLGELEAAEAEARTAVDLLRFLPLEQIAARARLATILLDAGRAAEALAAASAARAQAEALHTFGFRGGLVLAAHLEALAATGDHPGALAARAAARARLLAQSAKIGDPEVRRCFLEVVPENARIFAPPRR